VFSGILGVYLKKKKKKAQGQTAKRSKGKDQKTPTIVYITWARKKTKLYNTIHRTGALLASLTHSFEGIDKHVGTYDRFCYSGVRKILQKRKKEN